MDGSPLPPSHQNVASIAATGFGLNVTLHRGRSKLDHQPGARTHAQHAALLRRSRLSSNAAGSITGWMQKPASDDGTVKSLRSIHGTLLGGVLTVRQCFREDQEIVKLADRIYRRVDFRWMLNGHPLLLSHGWKPESGFLKARWDTYSEDTDPLSPRDRLANLSHIAGFMVRAVARSLSLRRSQLLHDHRRAFVHAPVLTRLDRLS